jgi:hypothetical protein
MNWYLTDDAFYYFKTAQNIAEGMGISFDGVAPTNGFHPLWMVICVPVFALARYDLFLPLRVLAAIQIFLNAASGYLLYLLFSEKISKTTAWAAAIFWMFFPPIHEITTKLGLETGLNAFMLITFIYLLSRLKLGKDNETHSQEIFWVGLCGAGVLLSRLDNIFLLIMVGVWLVFHGKQINSISQIDFLLILLSATSSFFFRFISNEDIFNYLPFLYFLIGFSLVIKPTMLYIFHCYGSDNEKTAASFFINIFSAISLSSGLIFIILFIFHDILHILQGFPRFAVVIDWALSLFLIGGHHLYQRKRDLVNGLKEEDISIKTNYMIINSRYAGTAMPVSGQIKRWWGTLPNTIYGHPITTFTDVIKGLFDPSPEGGPFWLITHPLDTAASKLKTFLGFSQLENIFGNIFITVIVWIIFLAVVHLLIVRQSGKYRKYAHSLALLPFFTGTFFHAMSYKSTGYLHVRGWYWIGEMILIILFLGILLNVFIEMVEERSSRKIFASLFTFLVCGVLWGMFSVSIFQQFPHNGQVRLEYDLDGEVQFIKSQTEPGDVIGMTGGGLTAYFVPDRTILNLDGLINSGDYFRKLQDGETTEYLVENDVKYIYGEELVLLDSDPYRWIFTDTLTVLEKGPYFYLISRTWQS